MDRALAKQIMWTRFIWFACLMGLALGWWRLMDRMHAERALEDRARLIVNDDCPIDAQPVDVSIDPAELPGDRLLGFCSVRCAEAWSVLAEPERDETLANVEPQNSND